MSDENRTITDADAKAIADQFVNALQSQAKNGLWNMVTKMIFTALIALAAWSAGKGGMGQ